MRSPLGARLTRFVAAMLLATAALVPSAASAGEAPLTLRIATDQKLETLNPWHSVTVADYEIFQVQYELLVGFDGNLQPAPAFAETWESSTDGMTHTFHIREGMKWSDGQPATCEDARWTYQFVLDVVASDRGFVGSGYLEPYLTNTGLQTVACTDPLTLVATTEFPTTLLTQAYVPILPKHVWSQYTMRDIGNANADGFFANEPPVVGSGPYVAVEWEPGEFIKMARNPNYWGTPGAADELIFLTFASEDSMVTALRNREVDYVRGTGADQFDALATDPDIRTAEGYSNGYTYLSFNTRGNTGGYGGSTSALTDLAFRDALGFAIDRDRLIEEVLAGHGAAGTTHIPPYHANWHVEPERPRAFDIAEANRRLDAAGYTRGTDGRRVDKEGKPINLRLTWPDSEDHAADAQFIKGWYEDIGIGVDAFVTEEGKLLEDLLGPDYDPDGGPANWDFYMWGWVGDPDPMSLLSFFTTDQIASGTNDCFYSDDRYDELFKLQQRATDEATRKQHIAEMQQLFYDAACYHILYYDSELHASRTDQFGGWVNQPPDGGTPIFGYGYSGYMALTAAGSEPSAAPSAAASAGATAGPGATGGTPTPAPTAVPGATGSGGGTPVLLLIVAAAVIAAIVVGFLLTRRRRTVVEEE